MLCDRFQLLSPNIFEKKAVKSVMTGPGRAGPSRAGYGRDGSDRDGSSRISVLHRKIIPFPYDCNRKLSASIDPTLTVASHSSAR